MLALLVAALLVGVAASFIFARRREVEPSPPRRSGAGLQHLPEDVR
jgi:hypothetical protein